MLQIYTETPNASESLPSGFCSVGNYVSLKPETLAQKAIPVHSNMEEMGSFWLSILEEYTGHKLTYPETDKLVALSAISRRLKVSMEDVYLAAHFLDDVTLEFKLAGRVAGYCGKKRRGT